MARKQNEQEPPSPDLSTLEWPSPELTPRMIAFFERAVSALRAEDPSVRVLANAERYEVAIAPDAVESGDAPEGLEDLRINLLNMYERARYLEIARLRGEPEPGDPVEDVVRVYRFIKRRGDLSREDLLERCKPALLGARDYLDMGLHRRPLRTEALHLAYVVDFDVGVAWITTQHLEQHEVGPETLHEHALANLGKAELHAMGMGDPDDPAGPFAVLVESSDGLASSRVFDAELRARLTEVFPAGYRFVVPTRDALLALSVRRLDACGELMARARENHATAPHPISPLQFAPGELVVAGVGR